MIKEGCRAFALHPSELYIVADDGYLTSATAKAFSLRMAAST